MLFIEGQAQYAYLYLIHQASFYRKQQRSEHKLANFNTWNDISSSFRLILLTNFFPKKDSKSPVDLLVYFVQGAQAKIGDFWGGHFP